MNERNVKKELSDNEELSHPESIREGEGSIIESSINMIENPSNDDDSDEGDFLFHGVNSLNIIEVDDNKKKKIIHSLFPLFICLITKNNIKIQQLSYDTPLEQQALTSTKQLLDGKYLEMIKNNQYMRYDELFQICKTSNTPFEDICRLVSCVISSSSSPIDAELICYQCLILAYAYFELYCQCNYTGPELSPIELSQLGSDDDMGVVSKNVIRSLECDGVYPFRLCQLPHTLFIARTILLYIADPSRASWQQGIQLDNSGKILSKLSQNELDLKTVRASKFLDILKQWLSFRACVIHLRLLQSQNYTKVPTLWKECEDMTGIIDQRIEDFQEDTLHNFDYSANYVEKEKPCSEFVPSSQIRTLYLLEKGLSYHFFDFSDKGKKLFSLAKDSAHLQVKLTAALGKRTKYQIDDHAQLLLVVQSALVDCQTNSDAATLGQVILTQLKTDNPSETKLEWEHGKYELGRRVVTESSTGEEVSIRNIRLDDTDGGEAENILLEEGVHFTQITPSGESTDESLASTLLHPIDQAIILSLCLDVSNSNPADGLTTEEMHPYIMSILNQYHKHQKMIDDIDIAKRKAAYEMHTQGKTSVVIPQYNQNKVEIYLNWMIYSTGLLERSYLEYEKRRTMDRAMLQIQALLDQHTTKLTTFQPDRNMIEDAAPAWERMKYMPCLIYPSQYEIKRDLADRYLRCQVFNSALNLFKELEMWDEVVTCFQLLQKPHRAELLVRERLAAGEETPYMVCALADLTKDESLYIKSWEISHKRYGRPLRTLARICFDSDRFEECVEYLDQALAVQPLVANAWYLRGIANMRLENWSEAIVSFNRCLQQDMEIGEAWANIGAVQMKQKNWSRAYDALQEAQKHKPREWRIIENLMMTTLEMKRLKECVYHMNSLLDLRHLSNRPLHQDELRELIIQAAIDTLRYIRGKDLVHQEGDVMIELETVLPGLAKDVENLLFRITNTLKSENHIWETASMYHTILAHGDDPDHEDKKGEGIHRVGPYEQQLQIRSREALYNFRLKQLRSIVQIPNWEREIKQINELIRVSECLIIACRENMDHMTKNDFYACKSLLSSSYLHLLQYYEKNGKSLKDPSILDIQKLPLYIDEFDSYYTSSSKS